MLASSGLATMLRDQMARELGGGGGLARALQSREQHDDRRFRAQVEAATRLAHHACQFLVNDADEGLARRQAARDLGADRARARGFREGLDDADRDIRFEQGHAHLPQRVRHVLVGQAAAAAQRIDGFRESVGEHVEHRPALAAAPQRKVRGL